MANSRLDRAPLLGARRLARRAVDQTLLLHPTSLSIFAGDLIVCQGASGAGKSILLRSLAALDRYEGELIWRDEAVLPERTPQFRSKVIYLPQSPFLPDGSVLSALQEPFAWKAHQERALDVPRISAWLQGLGRKTNLLDAPTAQLSSGETQIFALLRALQLDPSVLLLDEPTATTDPAGTRLVETLIEQWLVEDQRAIVWVTHDAQQAQRIANRRVTVSDGRVGETG